MVGESVEVTEDEISESFNSALAQNKETFAGSTSNYESALKSSLSTTYYHPTDDQGYGFVINILLKLDEDSLKQLTDMISANPSNTEAILVKRNKLIAEMEINVSNPNYKADSTIEDKDGNTVEVRDAMTDARNPYNKVGKTAENPTTTPMSTRSAKAITQTITTKSFPLKRLTANIKSCSKPLNIRQWHTFSIKFPLSTRTAKSA